MLSWFLMHFFSPVIRWSADVFPACQFDSQDNVGALKIRHSLKLDRISLRVPAEENEFWIESDSRTVLRLFVSSEQLRDACVAETNDAIEKYKEAKKTLAVSEEEKRKKESWEEVGDVEPVLFPNEFADYCQVMITVRC